MRRYWENETPVTASTAKNVLNYYPEAGQLSISRPPWENDQGVIKQGKTVTLNIGAITESDSETMKTARDIFKAVVERIDNRLSIESEEITVLKPWVY